MSSEITGNIKQPIIKIIGVGGAGCNCQKCMVQLIGNKLPKDSFVAINTDAQSLTKSEAFVKVAIGPDGLGAGANPSLAREYAEYSIENIKAIFEGCDLAFVFSGMGGGTGSGATAVVARIAKEMGVLVFSIITTPFDYEGSVRARVAKEAVLEVKKYSDITVVISNQLLFKVTNQFTTFQDSFFIVDKMCASFVAGIIHIISENGLINLDFADLKSVMANKGDGIIGVGYGEGEKAAQEAIESALSNSLLEENADTVSDKKTASDALVHISGNRISLLEVEEIMKRIQSELGSDVNIIYGVSISEQPNAMLKKNDNKVSTDNVMNNNIFENSVFNLSSGYNLSSDFNSAQQQVQSIAQWVQVMVIITGVNKKIVQEESIKYNNLQINPIQSYTEDKLDFTNNKFEEPQNNIFAFLNKIGKQKI